VLAPSGPPLYQGTGGNPVTRPFRLHWTPDDEEIRVAEMTVQLVAVERRLWSGTATSVVAQTTEGEIGILPGHEPVLGQLVEGGVVKVRTTDGDLVTAAVHGGFLSVTGDGVSVLAEDAELASEIDVEQARADLRDADELERARAIARLRATGHSV
jgi:F-type H+-transporting ATPase subunit epsilon